MISLARSRARSAARAITIAPSVTDRIRWSEVGAGWTYQNECAKHCTHTLYTFRSKRRPIPGGVFIFVSPVIAGEATCPPKLEERRRKQSSFSSAERKLDCFVACAPRNDGERARTAATDLPVGQISSVVALAPRHYFVEPDQCDLGRPVPFEKIFRFPFDPNHF